MNNITVIGNVGRDPELRYANSGTAVLKFSVADTIGRDDNKKTTWHDITVFGEMAENVGSALGKGQRVIVMGRLQKSKYTGRDGVEKEKAEIVADDVALSLRWASNMSNIPSPTSPEELPEDPF
ncbi:MAG: single-stranded DNA-binding protein [Ilumatobacteraceae bacterium]